MLKINNGLDISGNVNISNNSDISISNGLNISDNLLLRDFKIQTYNSSINELSKVTKFLNENTDLNELPKNGKVVFIICNPYFNTSYKLGNPVCNDCKIISENYIIHNYLSYCLLDSSIQTFKKFLTFFLSNKYEDLIIYYSGHGIQISQSDYVFDYETFKFKLSTAEPEKDHYDEYLLFDEYFKDDHLTTIFKNNQCKNVLFICDCCHSETILDKIPNNCCLISSCKDSESAIQLSDNGIFTYYLIKYFNTTLDELTSKINLKISKYNQHSEIQNPNLRNMLYYD